MDWKRASNRPKSETDAGIALAASAAEILLVEDNADHALIVRRSLAKRWSSSSVTWVRDGEEAMAHLKQCDEIAMRPKLILLDIKLPRLGGIDLLSRLRSHPNWSEIEVVMLTTTDCPDDIRRCRELGARGYIVKGSPAEEFLSTLTSLLEPGSACGEFAQERKQ